MAKKNFEVYQTTDVPAGKVGEVVQDFVDDGADRVTSSKQPDGKWTVRAEYGLNSETFKA